MRVAGCGKLRYPRRRVRVCRQPRCCERAFGAGADSIRMRRGRRRAAGDRQRYWRFGSRPLGDRLRPVAGFRSLKLCGHPAGDRDRRRALVCVLPPALAQTCHADATGAERHGRGVRATGRRIRSCPPAFSRVCLLELVVRPRSSASCSSGCAGSGASRTRCQLGGRWSVGAGCAQMGAVVAGLIAAARCRAVGHERAPTDSRSSRGSA